MGRAPPRYMTGSTIEKRNNYVTRNTLMNLLSDEEVARVSTAETLNRLSSGDEYIDLEDPSRGVRIFGESATTMGNVLPKKAVGPETWTRILAHLTHVPSENDGRTLGIADMDGLIPQPNPFANNPK